MTQSLPTKIAESLRRRKVAEIRLLHNGQMLTVNGYTHRQIEAGFGCDAVEVARRTARHLASMLAIGQNSEAEIQIVEIEIETPVDILRNATGEQVEMAKPSRAKAIGETVRHSSRSGL